MCNCQPGRLCKYHSPQETGDSLAIEFSGHDHMVYEVSKTYTGSAFVHIAKGKSGEMNPARIARVIVHIDDIEAVITALRMIQPK